MNSQEVYLITFERRHLIPVLIPDCAEDQCVIRKQCAASVKGKLTFYSLKSHINGVLFG